MSPLKIEVFADIACPWCYIGEHRLERALAARPELQVEWRWRPFQLQPNLPASGIPWDTFASAKFGGAARAQAMFEHVAGVGAEEGIQFAFDRIATAPNTADAHRLILFAQETGRQRDAALALFRAFYIFDERLGLSGAQPVAVFLRALDLAVQQGSTADP
jgi:predicted DsbA family dithiol-disulfide isomerase